MRLPAPRIIAIDDDEKHLEGLVQGLNRYGAACLPVHFTGEAAIAPCSQVRLIFADLHLADSPPGDHKQDFSTIGGLIEESIRPSGPYFIILWTQYPDQADALHDFLEERLGSVARPFTVQALDKNDHLNPQGDVESPESLVEAIGKVVAKQPRIGALLNWEERVTDAAADTVSSIVKLAKSAAEDARSSREIGRLLANLAVAAVGREHVAEDRFRAVNESLLPILADRIASLRSRGDDAALWQEALGEADGGNGLVMKDAASLNRLLHIAPSTPEDDGGERGAVIALPEEFLGEAFVERFDLLPEDAMEKQFLCNRSGEEEDSVRWVLVQTRAACDHAQNRPGPLPFHLGLCLPVSRVPKKTSPVALWRSPCFEHEDETTCLHVSASFPVSMSRKKAGSATLLFRLREQLLNHLIYHVHGHGARPGIISFRCKRSVKR